MDSALYIVSSLTMRETRRPGETGRASKPQKKHLESASDSGKKAAILHNSMTATDFGREKSRFDLEPLKSEKKQGTAKTVNHARRHFTG